MESAAVKPTFRHLPWKSLQEEWKTRVQLRASSHDSEYIARLDNEIDQIQSVLLERKDGFEALSNALKDYPGINDTIYTIQKNKKPVDAKVAPPTTLATVTSLLSYASTYSLSFFGSPINQQAAAEAKIIADKLLDEHKEQSTKGHLSTSDECTLRAIRSLRTAYTKAMTNGSVKKAIEATFEAYGFPLDEKQFEKAIQQKAKKMNTTFTL